MSFIENPVLRGFHGDPSILRVGEDYFLAASSFEWFPGAPLYHSRDLAHWRLIGNILDSRRLLDLNGVQPSFGVWAPDLSYNARRRRFYLMYSNVHCRNKWFFDVDNYDEILNVILIPHYAIPPEEPRYFSLCQNTKSKILILCAQYDLWPTTDVIEDMGEHWYIVRRCGPSWPQ